MALQNMRSTSKVIPRHVQAIMFFDIRKEIRLKLVIITFREYTILDLNREVEKGGRMLEKTENSVFKGETQLIV